MAGTKWKRWNVCLLLLLLALMLACLCIGKYTVSPFVSLRILVSKLFGITGNWEPMAESVVLGLRLPRVLAATIIGSALAISGAAYQGMFRNPLISPDFLGVSAGSCIGAAIAILMSLSSLYIQLFAFIGGLLAVCLALLLPKLLRSNSNLMLVVSGIIVGGLMSSILGFIKYIADPETELAAITYWQMGSFSYVDFGFFISVLPMIIITSVILLLISWWINVMSLGEREAKLLGANVKKVRYIVIICATFLTAGSVCIAGTIGWVGLIVPHFARILVGSDNRRLLPTSCLMGAIFLLFADTLARVIGSAELPISIVTGLVGAPFYAWLLYRQRTRLL